MNVTVSLSRPEATVCSVQSSPRLRLSMTLRLPSLSTKLTAATVSLIKTYGEAKFAGSEKSTVCPSVYLSTVSPVSASYSKLCVCVTSYMLPSARRAYAVAFVSGSPGFKLASGEVCAPVKVQALTTPTRAIISTTAAVRVLGAFTMRVTRSFIARLLPDMVVAVRKIPPARRARPIWSTKA